jgi:hypothetical protein
MPARPRGSPLLSKDGESSFNRDEWNPRKGSTFLNRVGLINDFLIEAPRVFVGGHFSTVTDSW